MTKLVLQWVGASLQGLVGLGCVVLGISTWTPIWIAIGIVLGLMFLAGAVLTAPFLVRPIASVSDVPAQSAFIRGDASGSRIDDVRSDADLFIDGAARESILTRIRHSPRAR
jgi:hypothetical protein